MQGIPSDILAAHYGEEEEPSSKVAKVEVPMIRPPIMPNHPLGMAFPPRPYGLPRPMFNPAMMVRPPLWPPQPPQAWYPQQQAVSAPPMVAGQAPQQPLFPIQNMPNPMTSAPANLLQTSFAMAATGVPSPVAPQVSQPLFPVNTTGNGAAHSPFSLSVSPANIPASSPASVGNAGFGYVASNQGTGGPAVGLPPAPATNNKASATQPATSEVYLVWDDEAMSMEERRMSLPMYLVHDETSQMSSVDAAFDRRVSESWLAGRMSHAQ